MKFTVCVTQRCNLTCHHCSPTKGDDTMSLPVARSVVDSVFEYAPPGQGIEIDLVGGEPLLEVPTLVAFTDLVERRSGARNVKLTVVSNGTIFSDDIAAFLLDHDVRFALSCDGPPAVQDRFRRFADGRGISEVVERTVRRALRALGSVPVRAVYRPETLRSLPEAVEYLAGIGLRQIHLAADSSGNWSKADADVLPAVYEAVADQYVKSHLAEAPLYVSLLDSKIALMLRGGCQRAESCCSAEARLAFATDGRVRACARHAGCSRGCAQVVGDVARALSGIRADGGEREPPAACRECDLLNYCTTWCGCSGRGQGADRDPTVPFLCASERASIETAGRAYQTLQTRLGSGFMSHLS